MIKLFCKTTHSETDYTVFGGLVYPSDFDTSHSRGNIAERIERDKRFDEQCRKNVVCDWRNYGTETIHACKTAH